MTDIDRDAVEDRSTSPPPAKSRISSILLALGIAVVVIVLAGAAIGIIKLRQPSGELNPKDYNLPAFVYDFTTPPGTPDAYAAATKFADDFSQIPCYCGCARDPGHKSLVDCFISARDGNNMVYDSHGAGWDICIGEALDVLQGKNEGKSITEIRSLIDSEYGGKYAEPTPTPPLQWKSGQAD